MFETTKQIFIFLLISGSSIQSETVGKFPPPPPLQLPSIDQHLQYVIIRKVLVTNQSV